MDIQCDMCGKELGTNPDCSDCKETINAHFKKEGEIYRVCGIEVDEDFYHELMTSAREFGIANTYRWADDMEEW